MIIFWVICATSATSIYIALQCASYHSAVDSYHRLTSDKIIKKKEGKIEIDQALYRVILSISSCISHYLASSWSGFYKYCCCCLRKPVISHNYDIINKAPDDLKDLHIEIAGNKHNNNESSQQSLYSIDDVDEEDMTTYKVKYSIVTHQLVPTNVLYQIENGNILLNNVPLFDSNGFSLSVSYGKLTSQSIINFTIWH